MARRYLSVHKVLHVRTYVLCLLSTISLLPIFDIVANHFHLFPRVLVLREEYNYYNNFNNHSCFKFDVLLWFVWFVGLTFDSVAVWCSDGNFEIAKLSK